MAEEIKAGCPKCGGKEFGFVFRSTMPGLYGANLYGEVVSIDHTMFADPVFTCKKCYAEHCYQEDQDDWETLALAITEG